MPAPRYIPIRERPVKSYTFKVVLEQDKWPDEPDKAAFWRAYIPVLEEKGAATFGETKVEALENLQTLLRMVIASMLEHGETIPEEPSSEVQVSSFPRVAVNV